MTRTARARRMLAALALPVSAADVLEQERQILQVDSLTDPLSGQTREALEDYSPASQTDPASAILDIFKWASNLSVGTLREAVQTAQATANAALSTATRAEEMVTTLVREVEPIVAWIDAGAHPPPPSVSDTLRAILARHPRHG